MNPQVAAMRHPDVFEELEGVDSKPGMNPQMAAMQHPG
jgi:hypothetical protein